MLTLEGYVADKLKKEMPFSDANILQDFVKMIEPLRKVPSTLKFLISFLVDANGGVMSSERVPTLQICVPTDSISFPTRITIRLVKKENISSHPPLLEGENFANKVLEFGPVGSKLNGPIFVQVPHFASLRGGNREIVILKSETGQVWKEHKETAKNLSENQQILYDNFLSTNDVVVDQNLQIIIIREKLPKFLILISRFRLHPHLVGSEGGIIQERPSDSSFQDENFYVQSVFPQGALKKQICIGLQIKPCAKKYVLSVVKKELLQRVKLGSIVTIEPRRRKFHKGITVNVPKLLDDDQRVTNYRMLCSVTDGAQISTWEDITSVSPIQFHKDHISFVTSISARFWLIHCSNLDGINLSKMCQDLFRCICFVPYLVKMAIFCKEVPKSASYDLKIIFHPIHSESKFSLEHNQGFQEIVTPSSNQVLELLDGVTYSVFVESEKLAFKDLTNKFTFNAFQENNFKYTLCLKTAEYFTKSQGNGVGRQNTFISNLIILSDLIPREGISDLQKELFKVVSIPIELNVDAFSSVKKESQFGELKTRKEVETSSNGDFESHSKIASQEKDKNSSSENKKQVSISDEAPKIIPNAPEDFLQVNI